MGGLFKILFYQPIFNLLIILYNLFSENLGVAIVVLAILSRVITIPITRVQIKQAEKAKEMQRRFDEIKKKYKKNKEKMNEEIAKLQAKYLPGQLGGCLPMIILIILLIQVRGGIVNLVEKGWHAFNEIAYIDSLKREEDFIQCKLDENFEEGEYTLQLNVKSSKGNELKKEYAFEVVSDKEKRIKEIKNERNSLSSQEIDNKVKEEYEKMKAERATDISIYSDLFNKSRVSIPLAKFFIFTTKSETVYLLEDQNPKFEFYLRAPSNQTIKSDEITISMNENDITNSCEITQGEKINLNFLGIDLSKVAADFSLKDKRIIPYVVLAVLVGSSQYLSTQILSGLKNFELNINEKRKKEQKKKKKSKDEDIPDMSELMNMTSKQMTFLFPILTVFTSLGYWGGANIFPAGLSIFWTVQNFFVIIQQILMNKESAKKWLKYQFSKEAVEIKNKSVKKSNKSNNRVKLNKSSKIRQKKQVSNIKRKKFKKGKS